MPWPMPETGAKLDAPCSPETAEVLERAAAAAATAAAAAAEGLDDAVYAPVVPAGPGPIYS